MKNHTSAQISINKLTKVFGNDGRTGELITAYEDLSFQVSRGEFICILGPSGCGKSTLLRSIASLEKASSGEVQIAPSDSGSESNIGMVFQERGIFPWMTVTQNIRFLLENNPHIDTHDIDSIVDHYVSKVGLNKFAAYFPHQISGGMKQRVSIARSFANNPDILLMDEPFVFLDSQTRTSLQELLLNIWQETHKSVVFVTHDIEEAIILADRIIVMTAHPGRIKTIIDVDFPRPRHVSHMRKTSQYHDLINTIGNMISDEISDLMPTLNTTGLSG